MGSALSFAAVAIGASLGAWLRWCLSLWLNARVENLTEPYDVVSSRAFASLVDFTTWSRQALGQGGVWMALKGKHPVDELASLPADVEVFHVEQLTVPGLDAERCIVWMRGGAARGVTPGAS